MKLKFTCKICGNDFQNLGHHIRKTHVNITQKEYYDKYLKKDNEGFCLYCNKETKFIKISKGYNLYCNDECFYKSDLVKKHREETVFNKTGKKNVFQIDEIKEKIKKTMVEKYGVKKPLQNEYIQHKCKQTCNKVYGCDNPFQNENVKQKSKTTLFEHYGCEYIQYAIKRNKMQITNKIQL